MTDTAVITDVGRAEFASAKSAGLQVTVTGAIFSSSQISNDPTQLTPLTTLPNIVFTADSSYLSYRGAGADNILFTVRLNNTIGDFNIGSFGLTTSQGNLLTITSLSQIDQKLKSTSTTVGDIRFYEIIIDVSNSSSILNLSLLVSEDASLPEVGNENLLPSPNTSTYTVYYVDQWLAYHGKPALASRLNGQWYFYPAFEGSHPELFDASVQIGSAVYFDRTSGRFQNSVANVIDKAAIGLRGQNSTLVKLGEIYISPNSGNYFPGSTYYVDVQNPGILQITPSYTHVGYAITDTIFLLNNFLDVGKVIGRNLVVLGDSSSTNLDIINQSATTDSGFWSIRADSTNLNFQARNDTNSSFNNFFKITRVGYNITKISLSVGSNTVNVFQNGINLTTPLGSIANSSIDGSTNIIAQSSNLTLQSDSLTAGITVGNINWSNFTLGTSLVSINLNNSSVPPYSAGTPSLLLPVTFQLISTGFRIYDTFVNSAGVLTAGNGIYLTTKATQYGLQSKSLSLSGDIINLQSSNSPIGPGVINAISDLFTAHDYLGNGTALSRVMSVQNFSNTKLGANGPGQPAVIRGPGWTIMIGSGQSGGTIGDLIYFPEALYNYTVIVSAAASLSQWSETGGYFHPAFFGTQYYNQYAFIVTGVRLDTINGTVGSSYTYPNYQTAKNHYFSWIAIGQTAGQ